MRWYEDDPLPSFTNLLKIAENLTFGAFFEDCLFPGRGTRKRNELPGRSIIFMWRNAPRYLSTFFVAAPYAGLPTTTMA